jgi:hypothetical protein
MRNPLGNSILTKFRPETVVVLFFLIYLLIGLSIFDDYGISYDEGFSRSRGIINYNYILKRNHPDQLLYDPGKYHGPAFDIFLVFIEDKLPAHTSRDLYLIRHLLTFFVFYISVWFFYLLCKDRFHDWKAGLLGSGWLILSPRIFADSFYNVKDLAFLSVFIISIYTLVNYLDHKTWLRTALHAVLCAFLIDMRIMGLLVPCLTYLCVVGDHMLRSQSTNTIRKTILSLLGYSILLIACIILFFPILWENPVYHFVQAFLEMKQFPWPGNVLYLGQYVKATNLPWHYIPVWLMITTPLLYTVTFCIGVPVSLVSLARGILRRHFDQAKTIDLICGLWFFLPLFTVIWLKSVVYDGWRHMFFIYPAFLLIVVNGVLALFTYVKRRFKGRAYTGITGILIALILVSLLDPVYFMIKYHPYQNVYFNRLAGKNMESVKQNFELDYWGLSFRQAFEYILQYDPRARIKIFAGVWKINAEILPERDKKRIMFVDTPAEADYFVSNYRDHISEYPYEHEFYSITIDGAEIMVVYKLKT